MSDHLTLTDALRRWPDTDLEPQQFESRHYQRLAAALSDLRSGSEAADCGDIGGLTRTVLMHQSAEAGQDVELLVPRRALGFPEEHEWGRYGITVRARPPGKLRIGAEPWRPDWLDGYEHSAGVDASAYERVELARRANVLTDPAVTDLLGQQYSTYISPGQAMAVRASFLMAPGETLLVNLPTGQGKSLAFQGPVGAAARAGRVSVLVVPTTALARDHERRYREEGWADVPGAYHGGLSEEEKAGFRSRIAAGTQVLVAASPEAVLSGLRRSIVECSRRGDLAYFVVDEAHIVDQWGAEFRPEYQFLASFRDMLSDVSPEGEGPRTLLLSATVTAEVFRTLEGLFGTIRHVSAVHLRPEIEFWMRKATDRGEKIRMLREAVRHLPRPFILYSCTVEDAGAFYDLVRSEGIVRVRKVIGGTNLEGVLEAWSDQKIDIVVATSAFGLGVDNSDVRAVVHACIPESADRFYQEVGRGGRDGRSSLSLTVYESADWRVARRLSSPKVIRDQGWPRWESMWRAASYDKDADAHVVRLQAKPPGVIQEGGANLKWNQVTLTLMARAGVIDLVATLPDLSELDDLPSDEAVSEYLRERYDSAVFRVREPSAVDDKVEWEARVLGERERAQEERRRAFATLHELFAGHRPINRVLKDVYALPGLRIQAPNGRCPATRNAGTAATYYVSPCPVPPSVGAFRLGGWFADRDSWPGYLTYDAGSPGWKRQVVGLLETAVQWGFLEVLLPADWMANKKILTLHRRSPSRFVIVRDVLERPCLHGPVRRGALRVPQVVLVPPNQRAELVQSTVLGTTEEGMVDNRRLVIFEEGMLVPGHERWRFADHVPVLGGVSDFLREVGTWQS